MFPVLAFFWKIPDIPFCCSTAIFLLAPLFRLVRSVRQEIKTFSFPSVVCLTFFWGGWMKCSILGSFEMSINKNKLTPRSVPFFSSSSSLSLIDYWEVKKQFAEKCQECVPFFWKQNSRGLNLWTSSFFRAGSLSSWPNISQFWSFPIRPSMNFMSFRNVDRQLRVFKFGKGSVGNRISSNWLTWLPVDIGSKHLGRAATLTGKLLPLLLLDSKLPVFQAASFYPKSSPLFLKPT